MHGPAREKSFESASNFGMSRGRVQGRSPPTVLCQSGESNTVDRFRVRSEMFALVSEAHRREGRLE